MGYHDPGVIQEDKRELKNLPMPKEEWSYSFDKP